ncbi:MAG TPA: sodium:proton antiporter [Candidatus Marinimicrobia bacterium]|mgnify:CR=1 FL=1|nr:sodium:proton antiporter [Candidatus Neomarinimicrobiota bacterium]
MVAVFADTDNAIIIFMVLLLGSVTHLIEQNGGINGFVQLMTEKRSIIGSRKAAQFFTWIMGLLVFTSGTLSTLLTGAIARPLNDALKVSHEKAAFIVHSTSTPVCVLIPLSGWGAFMIGLIKAQDIPNATEVLVQSIPLNFYAIITVFIIPLIIFSGKDWGPMARAEKRAKALGELDEPGKGYSLHTEKAKALPVSSFWNMLIPIAAMLIVILGGLIITGKGSILQGDGIKAIMWGVIITLLIIAIQVKTQRLMTMGEFGHKLVNGAGPMLTVAFILVLAFSMGSLVQTLGTGQFLAAKLHNFVSAAFLPAIIFLVAAIISFSTGSSMGTMAVVMPLAMPLAMTLGVASALAAAAVFSGSIFGDHGSPISDTTIMSCSTTGCDVMDHIKTQLPYALVFAAFAALFYLFAGFLTQI